MTTSPPATCHFPPNTPKNVPRTTSATNLVNSVALRDDAGFTLGTVSTDTSVTLQSNGTVNQVGIVTAPTLTLTGTAAGSGDFNLGTQDNVIGTASTTNTVNSVALRDDGGFILGATAADTSVTLQTDAAVTQSGALTGAPAVTLISTGGTGDFTLTNAGNVLGSVSSTGAVDVVSVRDDGGFSLGTLTTASLALQTDGTVTQTGVVTAPTLTMTATTAGSGNFTLNTQSNVIGTASTTNLVNSVALRDDAGFILGATDADTSVTLQTNAAVTQSGALTGAAAVTLVSGGGTGDFTLNNAGNVLGSVASTGAVDVVSLRDDGGFSLGTLTTSSLALQTSGAITQTGVVTAPTLTMTGSAVGSGDFTLNTQNNVIGTASTTNTVNTVALRDDGGFTVGGISSDTSVALQSNGTVNQTGAVTTPTLTLSSTTAGGTFTLNTQNNSVTTLDANNTSIAALSFRDDNGFTVAGIDATGNVVLTSNGGAITQSAGLLVDGTTTVTAGGAAITLNGAGNDFLGAVTLGNSGANAVQIADVNNISLDASTVGGALTVNANAGAGTITLLGGTYATTNGLVTLTGATSLAGNTTVNTGTAGITFNGTINGGFSLTLNNSAANTFNGAIGNTSALASITTDTPGTTSLGGNVTTLGAITFRDVTSGATRTLISQNNQAVLVNGPVAVVNTSGPITMGGLIIGSLGTPVQLIKTPSSLTLTQQATAFFTGPAIPAAVIFPPGTSITYNGALIAASAAQQQALDAAGNASSSIAAVAAEEANKTFGTDSVAEDVEYGFAGEIGATPPMDHRIDESGISLPRCVQEAREGLPCK
jgi:hypothetical protein